MYFETTISKKAHLFFSFFWEMTKGTTAQEFLARPRATRARAGRARALARATSASIF